MANDIKLIENYSLIRQPYRITMSMWNYTVWQKRILTKIISRLQRNITLLERGAEFGQLELFKNSENDTIQLRFLLTDFIKDGKNYAQFKKALNQLRSVNVEINRIVLPAVRSRKAKKPAICRLLCFLGGLVNGRPPSAALWPASRRVRVPSRCRQVAAAGPVQWNCPPCSLRQSC